MKIIKDHSVKNSQGSWSMIHRKGYVFHDVYTTKERAVSNAEFLERFGKKVYIIEDLDLKEWSVFVKEG